MVIPKSVTPSRIAENFDVWDFRLDKDELGEIAKLDQGKRLGRTRISLAGDPLTLPPRRGEVRTCEPGKRSAQQFAGCS